MRPPLSPALALLLGLAQTASGAPLYIGAQEFDTSDRELMSRLVQSCATLLEEDAGQDQPVDGEAESPAANGEAENAPDDTASRSETGGDASAARDVLVIDVDALASGGGENLPAGEGVGGSDSPEGAESTSAPDLSKVTLQHCREAGVVF